MRLDEVPVRPAVAALLFVAALPVTGRWLREGSRERCALDGQPIVPAYRVRIVERDGGMRPFCCIRCAQLWLERSARPAGSVSVTDEVSGQDIDATRAHFVRSSVVTTPTTGNRIHAFSNRADAVRHAHAGGTILSGPERPFGALSGPADAGAQPDP